MILREDETFYAVAILAGDPSRHMSAMISGRDTFGPRDKIVSDLVQVYGLTGLTLPLMTAAQLGHWTTYRSDCVSVYIRRWDGCFDPDQALQVLRDLEAIIR